MRLVIADTSPINYLLLIGHIQILPSLFEKVILPSIVRDELTDAGEEDAIALAIELHAELLLMDDREAVAAARSRGLTVTGTLGVLGLAAQRGLLNLADAFDRLKSTNFRYRQETMDALLKEADDTI